MTSSDPPLILLVDDYADANEIYGTYLSFCGFRVACASSGAEAIAEAVARRPALILLDIRMPVMTGTDVMKALRADPRVSGTLIVALTAHALDDEREAALRAGFDAVIPKPCLPDALVEHVKRLLDAPDVERAR